MCLHVKVLTVTILTVTARDIEIAPKDTHVYLILEIKYVQPRTAVYGDDYHTDIHTL